MSFPRATVTHAELVNATKDGTIAVRLVGEPVALKYPKQGGPVGLINFQFNGKAYQYSIENPAIWQSLHKHDGHMVELFAAGAREEATLEIKDVAAPAAQLPPRRAPTPHDDAGPATPPAESTPKPFGRFSSMTYGRTINLGNYENFRLEMTVDINEQDDQGAAFATLVKTVDAKCATIRKTKEPSAPI